MQGEQMCVRIRPSRSPWRCLFPVLIGVAVMNQPSGAGAQDVKRLKLDEALIAVDTDYGQLLLEGSNTKQSYFPLSMYFTTQDNLGYCGVASSCMVLNAIEIERPVSPEHEPFRLFTQTNLFNPKVSEIIIPEKVRKCGMPLKTLGRILACYPVKVEVVQSSETDLPAFRKAAIDVLKSRDSYLVVNYLRKAIKQETGGHISPIAAYHEGEDRFLILDVSRYKYPPVWVKAEALWEAMKAVDYDSGKSRGYVIIRRAER